MSPENIFDIMELQDFFQISSLRSLCEHFLMSWIDNETVWCIKREAECYRYNDVSDKATWYMYENFQQILVHPRFMDVPFDLIMECLDSEFLAVPPEDILIYHLAKWVSHDLEERLQQLIPLLDKIDVTVIDNWNTTRTRVLDLFKNSEISLDILVKWFDVSFKRRRIEDSKEVNRYKETASHVLLSIGGLDSFGTPVSTVECIKSLEDTWKPMLSLIKDQKSNSNLSMVLPTMKTARLSPVITSTEKDVYVLGGTEGGTELEVYHVSTNSWETLPSFPIQTVVEPSMTVLDGSLYCSGGAYYKNGELSVSDEFWVLHPNSQTWSKLSPMKSPRQYHHLVSLAGSIFSIGGLSQDSVPISIIEKYDPVLDIWFVVTSLPEELPFAVCCFPLRQFLYVFCGDNLFRYCSLKSTWRCIHKSKSDSVRVQKNNCRVYCVRFGHQVIIWNNNYSVLRVHNLFNGFSTEWPNQRKTATGLSSVLVPMYHPPQV
ncbi:kelch-like protein 1 isoform X2 [Cimex lectularius]|nr:kelch-like protein 1 isoform X2 [Cimex lectularius]